MESINTNFGISQCGRELKVSLSFFNVAGISQAPSTFQQVAPVSSRVVFKVRVALEIV